MKCIYAVSSSFSLAIVRCNGLRSISLYFLFYKCTTLCLIHIGDSIYASLSLFYFNMVSELGLVLSSLLNPPFTVLILFSALLLDIFFLVFIFLPPSCYHYPIWFPCCEVVVTVAVTIAAAVVTITSAAAAAWTSDTIVLLVPAKRPLCSKNHGDRSKDAPLPATPSQSLFSSSNRYFVIANVTLLSLPHT